MLSKVLAALRKGLTSKEVSERATVVENALMGQLSGKDVEAVRAVAEVVTALCNNQCEGVFDAGFFIFFKIRNQAGDFQVFHKRLGVRERAILDRQPTIIMEPSRLLERLENAIPLDMDRAAGFRAITLSPDD